MNPIGYLLGFLPWITFDVVSLVSTPWAALIALLLSLYFFVRARLSGVKLDAQILDVGTIIFFALLTVVAFAVPHASLLTYESGLSSAWLALIAWFSLLIGQPFTLGVAKRRAAPELWNTPRFRRTCTVLARVWATSFTGGAIATLACEATDASTALRALATVLAFGIPATFTHRYVKRVRAAAIDTEAVPATDH